jgi:hypothetical protein
MSQGEQCEAKTNSIDGPPVPYVCRVPCVVRKPTCKSFSKNVCLTERRLLQLYKERERERESESERERERERVCERERERDTQITCISDSEEMTIAQSENQEVMLNANSKASSAPSSATQKTNMVEMVEIESMTDSEEKKNMAGIEEEEVIFLAESPTADPSHRSTTVEKATAGVKKASVGVKKAGTTVVHGVEDGAEMVYGGTKQTFMCIGSFIYNIPYNWPRCYTFVVGIVFPLWLLIAVSMVLGHILASYETPEEISSNNAILASRANILVDEAHLFDFNATTRTLQGNVEEIVPSLENYLDGNLFDVADNATNAFDSLSFNWIR